MRAIEKKSRTTLLWALCLCLMAFAMTGTAWAAEPTAFDIKVVYPGYMEEMHPGGIVHVPLGTNVTISPVPMDGAWAKTVDLYVYPYGGTKANQVTLSAQPFERTIVVDSPVTCRFEFTWAPEGGKLPEDGVSGYAEVSLIPKDTMTAEIRSFGEGSGMRPGVGTEFEAMPKWLFDARSPNFTYEWKIYDRTNTLLLPGNIYDISSTTSKAMKVVPKHTNDSYLLTGAKLFCTVSAEGQSITVGPVVLNVGISVTPESGAAITPVTGRVEGGFVQATLKLNTVFGGNAPNADLRYLLQERGVNGGTWTNMTECYEPQARLNIPAADWGATTNEREYRFIVARANAANFEAGTASGVYRVSLQNTGDLRLLVSDGVTLDPESGVVAKGTAGDVTVHAMLEKAVNKVDSGTTTYTYEIFPVVMVDGEKTYGNVIACKPLTERVDKKDNEPLGVTFTPLVGMSDYVLRVRSDASSLAVDETGTFRVFSGSKEDVKVSYWTNPKTRDGQIWIDDGQWIRHFIKMTNGTESWKVYWKDDTKKVNPAAGNGLQWTNQTPIHNRAIMATVKMLGFNGAEVPNYTYDVYFGTPMVRLAWDMDLERDRYINKNKLINQFGSVVVTPKAKGGSDAYNYSWMITDAWTKAPVAESEGWTLMSPSETHLTFTQTHLQAKDGTGNERYEIWLKAADKDGKQTIVDSLHLLVTESSTVIIAGWVNGENIVTSTENGLVATAKASQMPELEASLVDSEEQPASYSWWVDGTRIDNDDETWTPDLDAQQDPYRITVNALSASDAVLATEVISLTVEEAATLAATATLSKTDVDPNTEVTMTVKVTSPVEGETYAYAMGTSSEEPEFKESSTDSESIYTFDAPTDPGKHKYYWSVTEKTSGATNKGELELTVKGTAPAFTIKPEAGASFVVGSTFKLVVTSDTGITASQLNWASDATDIATVDGAGNVTVKKAGFATVTATLKTDNKQVRYYGFTTTDEPTPINYTVDIPTLSFKKGTAGQAQFTSTPAGATYTYEGTLPKGMTLSSGGLLSGTPTESGTFTLTTLTVTWDKDHVVIKNGVRINVSGSGGGGGGGGCNGGFGIFALALGAFWALKRK